MDIIQKNVRSLSSTDIIIGTHNNIVRAIPHWSLEKGINHSLSNPVGIISSIISRWSSEQGWNFKFILPVK
jgi:hypothetical protein